MCVCYISFGCLTLSSLYFTLSFLFVNFCFLAIYRNLSAEAPSKEPHKTLTRDSDCVITTRTVCFRIRAIQKNKNTQFTHTHMHRNSLYIYVYIYINTSIYLKHKPICKQANGSELYVYQTSRPIVFVSKNWANNCNRLIINVCVNQLYIYF